MKNYLHYIKYLDVFSEEIGFVDQGKKNYRSWLGVGLSILLIAASVVLILMFGQEVYKRQKPNVAISDSFLENSQINMQEWPIYIILSDHLGEKIKNVNKYYNIVTYKQNYTTKGETDFTDYTPNHKVVKCNHTHFKIVDGKIPSKQVDDIVSMPSYCIDYDAEGYFNNPYKSLNSTFLDIDVAICDRTTQICADDLDAMITEAYVEFNFLNAYIDSSDFDNPVKYYFDSITTQITNKFLKRNFIRIQNNVYVSDDGWIIEDNRELNYYSLTSLKTEINNISEYYPLEILWTTLESPNIMTKTNRTYLKVQDLFAKIGGIVNAFIIIIQIFFSHYLRYNFIMCIRQHLNPDPNEKKVSVKNKNIASEVKTDKEEDKTDKYKQYFEDNFDKSFHNNTRNNYLTSSKFITNNTNHISNLSKKEEITSSSGNLLNGVNSSKKNINPISEVNVYKRKSARHIAPLNSDNDILNSNINLIEKNLNLNENRRLTHNKVVSYSDLQKNTKTPSQNPLSPKIIKKAKQDTEGNLNKCNFDIQNNNKQLINNVNIQKVVVNVPRASSILNFKYINLNEMNYLQFMYYSLTCNNKKLVYDKVREEIETLFDIFEFSSFIKREYLETYNQNMLESEANI